MNPVHLLYLIFYHPFPLLNSAHYDAPGTFQEILYQASSIVILVAPSLGADVTVNIHFMPF